jgi:PIN domain nuclease of toxin-antitoxin system
MNLLLDSQALLWALHDPYRLTPAARAAISDPKRAVYYSAAAAWELELKTAKGKLTLPDNWLAAAEQIGFVELPVSASDVRMGAHLPWHHSNPFGRLLVAQAISHGLHLATRDPVFAAYEVSVLAV